MEALCWARPISPYQYVLQLVNRKAGGLGIESALLAGEKVWYKRGQFAKENLLRNEAGTPDMEVLRQTGKGTDWKTELHVHLNEVRRCRWVSASRDSRQDILDIPWNRIWNTSHHHHSSSDVFWQLTNRLQVHYSPLLTWNEDRNNGSSAVLSLTWPFSHLQEEASCTWLCGYEDTTEDTQTRTHVLEQPLCEGICPTEFRTLEKT